MILKKCLIIVIACLLVVTPTNAQTDTPPPPPIPSDESIIETIDLAENPLSEVELIDVKIELFSDGSQRLIVSGEYGFDQPEITYQIIVDLETRSYLAVIVPTPQDLSGETLQNGGSKVEPLEVVPGTYSAQVIVRHNDIVGFELARTTNNLSWKVLSPMGNVAWLSYTDGCQGFTTPVGTHWYLNGSCSGDDPWLCCGYVNNYVSGSYYNSDWGDPGQNTYAVHESNLRGLNSGKYSYTWYSQTSGEDAWLISATVSGSCSCNGQQ